MRAAAGDGWWRHRHGGYGWVGPVFWPFAYYDFYDYAMWGYGYDDPFWDYGYGDIYAGIFSPYGYDDLAGYWPQGSSGGQVSARQGSSDKPQRLTGWPSCAARIAATSRACRSIRSRKPFNPTTPSAPRSTTLPMRR